MRLTEKKENGFYELKAGAEIYGEENGIRLVQIVGQYEDIEEELGIDLLTLFKALKNGIWYKVNHEVNQFIPDEGMHIVADCNGSEERTNYWLLSVIDLNSKECLIDFWVDNYGKTWALTKEELEGEISNENRKNEFII